MGTRASLSMVTSLFLLVGGCCSTSQLEAQVASLQEENARLRSAQYPQYTQDESQRVQEPPQATQEQANETQLAILTEQRRTECILRHNDAKMSCDLLFRGEPNGVGLQNKILQCMANKGFEYGLATCR